MLIYYVIFKVSVFHTDEKNIMRRIYQILAGYFNDNDADELTKDPVFCTVLGKDALASQPTMSRFFNRLDENSLLQFEKIFRILRQKIYGIRHSENVLLDLDSRFLQILVISTCGEIAASPLRKSTISQRP